VDAVLVVTLVVVGVVALGFVLVDQIVMRRR
jgi:hypothetical protein